MKNAGKACNNRLYRHIRTFEKIVKNYFVIYDKKQNKVEETTDKEQIKNELINTFDQANLLLQESNQLNYK